jgi:hypothetical protein
MGAQSNNLRPKPDRHLFGGRQLDSRNHLLFCECARSNFPAAEARYRLDANTLATLLDPVNPRYPVSRSQRLARKQSRPSNATVCRGRKPTPSILGSRTTRGRRARPRHRKVRRGESHRQNRGPNFQQIRPRIDLLTSSEARFKGCRPWFRSLPLPGTKGNGK